MKGMWKSLAAAALACSVFYGVPGDVSDVEAKQVTALATKNWDASTNVALDKKWTVTFNAAVSEANVLEKFVYVTDQLGNQVDVSVTLDESRRKLIVTPKEDYAPNATYQLTVKEGLVSETGKVLKTTVQKKFTTVSTEEVATTEFKKNYEYDATADTEITLEEGAYYTIYRDGSLKESDIELADTRIVQLQAGDKLQVSYMSNVDMPTLKEVTTSAFKQIVLQKEQSIKLVHHVDDACEDCTEWKDLFITADNSTKLNHIFYDKNGNGLAGSILNVYSYPEYAPYTYNTDAKEFYEGILTNEKEEPIYVTVLTKYYDVAQTDEVGLATYTLQPGEMVKVKTNNQASADNKSSYASISGYGSNIEMSFALYSSRSTSIGMTKSIKTYEEMTVSVGMGLRPGEELVAENKGTKPMNAYGASRYTVFEKTDKAPLQTYVLKPYESVDLVTTIQSTNVLLEHQMKPLTYTVSNIDPNTNKPFITNERTLTPVVSPTEFEQTSEFFHAGSKYRVTNTSDESIVLKTSARDVTFE